MNDFSSQTLHLVSRELSTELNEARAALETFGDHQDDVELLKKCGEHLHQVRGALRVVEVHGAALLTEEMEQGIAYLVATFDERRHLAEGLDALMRAMVQLPTYLERVLSGGRDMALILLPLLNDLRAVRGNALLSEGTLLLLNLTSDQQPHPLPPTAGESIRSVAHWARKLRPRFQLGLLGWIKGERPEQNLELLSRAAEKLEQTATTQSVFQLWWVVGAVVEAMREQGLEESASVKRLLGQADREMRRLYELGEGRYSDSPPLDLLNNLLYYVARARSAGPRVSAVRASFRLSELLPIDDEVAHARESLGAPSVKLMKTVASAIKEDLQRVKDALDIFVRKGGDQLEDLAGQLELLKKLGDTLGVLGLAELREKVQRETEALQKIVAHAAPPDDAALLRIAGTLINVEDGLDEQLVNLISPVATEPGARARAGDGKGGPNAAAEERFEDDTEFRQVAEAVLRECIVNMARIKEAIALSIEKPQEAQALDHVPQLLRGITAGLLMLGKTRAVEVTEGISRIVSRYVRIGGPQVGNERMDRLADAIVAVEYYLETVQAGRSDPWYMLDNAETCLQALANETFTPAPPPLREPLPEAVESTRTLAIDSMRGAAAGLRDAERTEVLRPDDLALPSREITQTMVALPAAVIPLTPVPATVATLPPVLETSEDKADPEFLELFIEEAKEEMVRLRQMMALWDENPQDIDSLTHLRRSFHTLKGSGRMVGAKLIGEFAWSMEGLLNRIISKTLERSADIMAVLRTGVAGIPELVEQLETGRAPNFDVGKTIERAKALAGVRDGALVHRPAVATPAVPAAELTRVAAAEAPAAPPTEEPEHTQIIAPAAELAPPIAGPRSQMDPVLHEIFSKETVGHLQAIHAFIAACERSAPPYPVTTELYRACHTLSGTAKTAGARQGIKIAEPLNHYIRKLFDNGIGLSAAGLAVLRDAVMAIDSVMQHIDENTGYFMSHPSIVARILELDQALDAEMTHHDHVPEGTPAPGGGDSPDSTMPDVMTGFEEFEDLDAVAPFESSTVDDVREGVMGGDAASPASESEPVADLYSPEVAAEPFAVESSDDVYSLEIAADGMAPALSDTDFSGRETVTPEVESSEFESSDFEEVFDFGAHDAGFANAGESVFDASHFDASRTHAAGATPVPEAIFSRNELAAPDGLEPGVSGPSMAHRNETMAGTLAETFGGEAPATEEPLSDFEHAESVSERVDGATSSATAANAAERVAEEPFVASEQSMTHEPAADEELAADFDADVAAIFSEEATELLDAADAALSEWSQDRGNKALTFELKRALHTLKGGARMAGITAMGDFSHELESFMELIEAGRAQADQPVFELLQSCLDELHRMRDAVDQGRHVAPARELMHRLQLLSGRDAPQPVLPGFVEVSPAWVAEPTPPAYIPEPANVAASYFTPEIAEASGFAHVDTASESHAESPAEPVATVEDFGQLTGSYAYSMDMSFTEGAADRVMPGDVSTEHSESASWSAAPESTRNPEFVSESVSEYGPEAKAESEGEFEYVEIVLGGESSEDVFSADAPPDGISPDHGSHADVSHADVSERDAFSRDARSAEALPGALPDAWPLSYELPPAAEATEYFDARTLEAPVVDSEGRVLPPLQEPSELGADEVEVEFGTAELSNTDIIAAQFAPAPPPVPAIDTWVPSPEIFEATESPPADAHETVEEVRDVMAGALEAAAQDDAASDSAAGKLAQGAAALRGPPVLPPGREPQTQERQEVARVDAELLDNLLNNAGEVSIFRSRLEQQVSSIDFNLAELGRTVTRLKEQLRKMELETEAQILNRHQEEGGREDFDPLELDRYSSIQQLSRALAESVSDVGSIEGLLGNMTREAQNLLVQQSRVVTELQNGLMRTRMVPFSRHVQRLSRLVRQVAADTGKRAELTVTGGSGELDRQVLERMLPPFEHMLRNSVVHGIEMPEERQALDKPEAGTIAIDLHREGAEMVIVIQDDGRGIDVQAVRDRARARGLLQPGRELTDEEALQLVLEPGFSTASNITQHAGRGVGMDVVVAEIKKLGGALFTQSTPGKGVTFTIRLPFTLAISQALIIRSGDELYALPLPTVEGVVRVPRAEILQHLEREQGVYDYGGQTYRFQPLAAFIGAPATPLPEVEASLPVVLIRAGEHSTAVVIDELVGSREIVVKALGPQIATLRGISGATILGDGRIVIILDMGALVRSEWRARAPLDMERTEDRRVFVLVVDDSITVRRVTQRLLERNGMRVVTAKDGVDALSILQDHIPDIILLDIEMPRMDGYELASHVRNDARLSHIPIVMITSRTGEKHRARAIELGVNDYLGKPYQESQLLDAIEPLVEARRA